jgi:hypothetical protein
MSLLDSNALANNEQFRARVKVAMVNAAEDISSQEIDSTYQKYHDKRSQHATSILNGPAYWVDSYSYACVAKGLLTEASPDGDIQFTVNAVYDSMAGVTMGEKPVVEEDENG